ncbi:UNVERIFIED_CONTAM: hypothetical protein Slati_4442600, partial [Sesamum latifolium]
EGVATDPRKVESMQTWPVPKDIKGLRGFLSLTRYYRKFIKGHGLISRPPTELLKKDRFILPEAAKEAFEHLIYVMTTVPVLALLDFSKPFMI